MWHRNHHVWVLHCLPDIPRADPVPLPDLWGALHGNSPPSHVPQAGEGGVDEGQEGLCSCCLVVQHWTFVLLDCGVAWRAQPSLLGHFSCHGIRHQFLQLVRASCTGSPRAVEGGWRQKADRPIQEEGFPSGHGGDMGTVVQVVRPHVFQHRLQSGERMHPDVFVVLVFHSQQPSSSFDIPSESWNFALSQL